MKICIIGLPQTGKKTLFKLLTKHSPSEQEMASGRPIKSIAEVKDPRFDKLVSIYKPKKEARARIEIELFPKLEENSFTKGDFIKDLSEADAICHAVRVFQDESVYHISGSVDPKRDIDMLNSELILHDLVFIEKRLERIQKESKSGADSNTLKEKEVLLKLKEQLDKEMPLRLVELKAEERKCISGYPFLTQKKMVVALNISEDGLKKTDVLNSIKNSYKDKDIDIMQVSAKVEAEIAQLENEGERKDFLSALGIEEPAIDMLTRLCIKALNLISYFTVGPDEVKQWPIKFGASAPEAAGAIHKDIQRGFIRAELIKYNDLIQLGSEEKVKEAGKFYLKGKDYIVDDGDVMTFRFSV